MSETNGLEIAIIGMAGRFPGARTVEQFWQNLCRGEESVTFFTDQELLDAGVSQTLLDDPNYVKARAILEDVELFDAQFFGYAPKEAEVTDPQHRLFLECAWEALEYAGYSPAQYEGPISVYAGGGRNTYLINNLLPNRALLEATAGLPAAMIGNDKENLTMQVSYKLNLSGPGITVQTACSTSLVAVHLACQSLLAGDSNIALAGGSRVYVPQTSGYAYFQGGINSPDGHCRAFDAGAQGIVGGNAVAVVVLKRLEDAIEDGDQIHAVIRGSAINNDGSRKVGYTAPSVEGQTNAIRAALLMAEVAPETISYVETHGTGTALGDPVEITALTQAFRSGASQTGFCAIGSVKTNIGHCDVTAGVAGLIKTVLALKHRQIPPSINFEQPNPAIDFADTPFYVNTGLRSWDHGSTPLRAGVSAFGIGGTNAHVIVEEAPPREASESARPWHTLVLSARTATALDAQTVRLAAHLREHPDLNLADVAYTLQVGRQLFDHRRALACHSIDDAIAALTTGDPRRVATGTLPARPRSVAFLFPGQGSQYVQMARELYEIEPLFREQIDRCAALLKPHLGLDLQQLLYPSEQQATAAAEQLQQTAIAQPALFTIGCALAQIWMSWGIRPHAMLGHSIGEYVAAYLAGVFSLEDALAIVAMRGRLMQQLPVGAMLAVALPEQDLQPLLGATLSLAAVNGPRSSVVAGPEQAIMALHAQLRERGIECRRLHTSHAFHSAMMEPIVATFRQYVAQHQLNPPSSPYISNVTGTWITPQQAIDPAYWASQLRRPVRFADGLQTLLADGPHLLLEVGPGQSLVTLARQQLPSDSGHVLLTSLRHPQDRQSDIAFLQQTIAQAWVAGARIAWAKLYQHEQRLRVALPSYPFERQRYWIEATSSEPASGTARVPTLFQTPTWSRSALPTRLGAIENPGCWLIFGDDTPLVTRLTQRVEQLGAQIITVLAGERFEQRADGVYTIDPVQSEHYDRLVAALQEQRPTTILHTWSMSESGAAQNGSRAIQHEAPIGWSSLLSLAQALGTSPQTMQLAVLTCGTQSIAGETRIDPVQAAIIGACRSFSQRNLICRSIDLLPQAAHRAEQRTIDQLLGELLTQASDPVVAYRGSDRWVQHLEAASFDLRDTEPMRGSTPGTYVFSGGLDEVGYAFAEQLLAQAETRLIIIPGPSVPERSSWEHWSASQEQDALSSKLRRLQSLESRGAQVRGITGQEHLQTVLDQLAARHGTLGGIIHILHDDADYLLEAGPKPSTDDYLRRLQRCVDELGSLEAALNGKPFEFCLLLRPASLSEATDELLAGSLAQLGRAFVQQHNQEQSAPWLYLDWPRQQPEQDLLVAVQRIAAHGQVGAMLVADTSLDDPSLKQLLHGSAGAVSHHARPALAQALVAPRNELEEQIAAIWRDLLGIAQIGVHDDFFQLGGHSLMGTQLSTRLRETFGVELPLRSLFEAATIAGLAELIATVKWTEQRSEGVPVVVADDWEQGEL
jgi:acyl transferase domain-containing protein